MDEKFYTLLNAAPVLAITSSTDATPIVVTRATHGLATGDRITIVGHTVNTNANGTWTVTKINANTFSLDGSTGTGGGGGGGTGCFAPAAKIPLCSDFDAIAISIDTDGGGTAAATLKLVGSNLEDCPDFAKTQSATRQYDFIDMIDVQNGSSIDGDTGFVVATADDHRMFEANTNGMRWVTILPTAGTAGQFTVRARLFKRG